MSTSGKHDRRKKAKVIQNVYPKWLICCEGASEVIYLKGLVDCLSKKYNTGHNIHFGIKGKCEGNIPGECRRQHISLIKQAEICQRNFNAEETWVIFDEDAKGTGVRTQKANFKDAVLCSAESDVYSAAWSSPSIEYWFSIHGKEYISGLSDKALKRKAVELIDSRRITTTCAENERQTCDKKCEGYRTCEKALDKPYLNSFYCLGALEGLRLAEKHGEKSIEDNKIDGKYDFENMNCCTTMQNVTARIQKYFEDIAVKKNWTDII